MKKHTKLLIGILLMLSISMVLVACFGGGGDPSTTTQNEKKEPTIVAEPLAIDDGLYFAALEAVNSSGYNLVDKAVMVYDICLESEGVKIQPDGKIEVSIPAPLADVLNYVVYHILDSEEIEALPARVEDGKIIFETTSFSTFVIATEENYVFADTTPENEHVQLFTLSLIDKFELFMGLKGIDSADDVTIRFNGVVQTEIFDDGDILYVMRNDFYKGQELTISVTPNNGYKFGYLALLKNNGGQGNNQSSSEYVYFYENEITINLGENWDGIMACELYPPESDLEERTFDITAYSERISLDDLTFTLNGVEMKGINTIRKDGGSSYHLIPTIKNGDVLTISANLPANTEFASFRLRDREGWIIEEVFENSITIYVDTNTGSLDLVIKEITYDGIAVDGFDAGWDNFYRNSGEEHWNVSVAQGAFKTTPADFSVWVYDDHQEYLLDKSEYSIDLGGFDINVPGVYTVRYTYLADPSLYVVLKVTVKAANIVHCDFSTLAYGEQYANESNSFGNVTVSTHNEGCHFNTQLRIYDGVSGDGYAIVKANGVITNLKVNAGYNNTRLEVYASTDGVDWYLYNILEITKNYAEYNVNLPAERGYKYLKFDADGAQVRIASITLCIE